VDFPKLQSDNCLLVNAKGCPTCINVALRPLDDASHSKIKVFLKLGIVNTQVVHMASFKVVKAYVISSFQTKTLFLRSEIRGNTIVRMHINGDQHGIHFINMIHT
jgi:hypothetical protein